MTSQEFQEKSGYSDNSVEAIEYLKSIDSGFYRIDKDYYSGPSQHASLNDAKVQKFFGTQSYHSFNQINYINFLEAVDIVEPGNEHNTRWALGLKSRPLLHGIVSVKYHLTKKQNSLFLKNGYKNMAVFGDVKILQNKYFLPLGFTYDSVMAKEDFEKLSTFQKHILLYQACILDISDDRIAGLKTINPLSLRDTLAKYDWNMHASMVEKRKEGAFQMKFFHPNHITGVVDFDKKKLLFFSIPFDEGWQIRVNGKVIRPILCNAGFMGVVLEKGKHEVTLRYEVPFLKTGIFFSIACFLLFFAWGIVMFRRAHDQNGSQSK
jgi:uncharacterized membrane protein YfhO